MMAKPAEKEKSAPRVSWLEQWNNVLQLSKDRKNEIGGITASIKDFEEMGSHEGGHWLLCAESIRRSHGVPVDRDDPESEYEKDLRADSYERLEEEIQNLREVSPECYRAYRGLFSKDLAADRDYEYLATQAREYELLEKDIEDYIENCSLPRVELRNAMSREDRKAYDEARRMADQARAELTSMLRRKRALYDDYLLYQRATAYLNLLTERLWLDSLIVEFARMRTMREQASMESRNTDVYNLFRKVTDPPPDGYGDSAKAAYQTIYQSWGLSERRAQEIVASKTEEMTGEKRKRGRPRKRG